MSYTSQQLIQFIHDQGYSDQDIATACECRRETISNIRLGNPRYNGNRINGKLEKIVHQLQQEQQIQEVQQKPQTQVFAPVAPVAPVAPKTGFTPQYVKYCGGCRGLLRTPREWQIGYHSNCR